MKEGFWVGVGGRVAASVILIGLAFWIIVLRGKRHVVVLVAKVSFVRANVHSNMRSIYNSCSSICCPNQQAEIFTFLWP